MTEPRLIEDMSFADYLGDPAPEPSVTSGIIRELLTGTPRHVFERTPRLNAHAVPENKAAFDLGSSAHALFVGHGAKLDVIQADSWRTNEAKRQRVESYGAGHTPILEKEFARVKDMADAAATQFSQHADIGYLMPATQREATIIWNEVGVTNRCRPDFLYVPPADTALDVLPPVIVHYKTTATRLSAAALPRYAAGAGWDITAAHYAAGVKALTGHEPRQYFAVQENTAPYLGLVLELDPIFVACGTMNREIALGIWAKCLRDNAWPGYPAGTLRLECPPWHEAMMTDWKDAALDYGETKRYDMAAVTRAADAAFTQPHNERGADDYGVVETVTWTPRSRKEQTS